MNCGDWKIMGSNGRKNFSNVGEEPWKLEACVHEVYSHKNHLECLKAFHHKSLKIEKA